MRQIVIDKSILRKHVVYRYKLSLVLDDYLFAYFIVYIPIFLTIKLLFFSSDNDTQIDLGSYVFLIVIDILMLLNAFCIHKLVVIEGIDLQTNRNVILTTLKDMFQDITFSYGNANVIRGQRFETFWKPKAIVISVLLDQSKIYINVLPTFRGGSLYLLGGISSYLKSRKIAKTIFKNLKP